MKRGLPFALVLLLSACAGSDEIMTALPPGYVDNAAEIVAQADWSSPETITMTLVNYEFQPSELTFHRDRPVRLVLVNPTTTDHSMVSEQFFKDIALKQVSGGGTAVAGPWLKKVVVPAGQTKEVWFVPARYGAYSFECDVTGHAAFGMSGLVNVVP